jgi:hypothetical protein
MLHHKGRLLPIFKDGRHTGHSHRSLKLRTTVLVKASSNLPDRSRQFRNPVWTVREKNMVMGPEGPKTKNDCSGEDQQQFTQQTGQASQ